MPSNLYVSEKKVICVVLITGSQLVCCTGPLQQLGFVYFTKKLVYYIFLFLCFGLVCLRLLVCFF